MKFEFEADSKLTKYFVSQQRVNHKIANLGSVLLRAADRADRDVSFDAIKTHVLVLARVREVKRGCPPSSSR